MKRHTESHVCKVLGIPEENLTWLKVEFQAYQLGCLHIDLIICLRGKLADSQLPHGSFYVVGRYEYSEYSEYRINCFLGEETSKLVECMHLDMQ